MKKTCQKCGVKFSKSNKLSYKQFESMKFCSRKCKDLGYIGYRHTAEAIEKNRKAHLGKPAWWKKGELNYFWRGGKTPQIIAERMSLQYKNWRRQIFERDNYTCQECGLRGGRLNADHIKSFTHYPELRYLQSNGRTLCVPCHIKTPTFGGKSRI